MKFPLDISYFTGRELGHSLNKQNLIRDNRDNKGSLILMCMCIFKDFVTVLLYMDFAYKRTIKEKNCLYGWIFHKLFSTSVMSHSPSFLMLTLSCFGICFNS